MSAYKNLINSYFRGSGSGTTDDPFVPAMNHATASLGHGFLTVPSAGFALPLKSTSTPAKWVTVQAYRTNTGLVAVGASGVSASGVVGTGTGVSLAAGESYFLPVSDLNTVYVDAAVNGEGVRFTYGV